MYCRTCQSCGHIQQAKQPIEYKGDSWRDLKCRKCKSLDLDYGHDAFHQDPTTGKLVKNKAEE